MVPMPSPAPPPPPLTPADLAPADARSAGFDFAGFSMATIDAPGHPWFERVYTTLSDEFGPAGEMEQRDVIAARMAWGLNDPGDGYAMQYTLLTLLCGDAIAAVHDHSTIVPLRDAAAPVVVHLSHAWVAPPWRGTGLAGWVRALPVRDARAVVVQSSPPGQPMIRPITLVGEMEPPDPASAARTRRLRAYEKAGYRKIDPLAVAYRQPDFRPPAVIDATGGPRPVPLSLIVRRIGREDQTHVDGDEVRAIIAALRAMYARTARPADMAALAADPLPAATARIALVPPTSGSSPSGGG
jgi:hypothetical protein